MTTPVFPYLLTEEEADALFAYRAYYQAGRIKRGLTSPSDGSAVPPPAITYVMTPELSGVLSTLQSSVATIQRKLENMADLFDTELSVLRDDVAAQSTVIASATMFMKGLAAQLALAEHTALAAGATQAQVSGVASVRLALEQNTAALAAAIPANTPGEAIDTPPAATTTASTVDASTSGATIGTTKDPVTGTTVDTKTGATVDTSTGLGTSGGATHTIEQPASGEQAASADQAST